MLPGLNLLGRFGSRVGVPTLVGSVARRIVRVGLITTLTLALLYLLLPKPELYPPSTPFVRQVYDRHFETNLAVNPI